MVVLLVTCSILFIICVIKWMTRDKTLYNFADSISGPKAYPIIGSSHKFIIMKQNEEERFKMVQKMLAKYEKNSMTKFWLGPVLFVFMNEPELIKQVLNSPHCLQKSFTYKFLRLDKGLLAAKHDIWVEQRKFLEESFKLDIIKSFIPIFVDSSNQMLAALDHIEDKANVNVFKFTSKCALTMVLATSFGISADEVCFSDDILKAVEELIKIISHRCHEPVLYVEALYRITKSYYREKKYRKRCYNYLDQVIKDRREFLTPNNNHMNNTSEKPLKYQRDEEMGISSNELNKNFIDHLIQHGSKFSDEEIHDHIYTFVAAGYETIALQTFFTLLLLAIHIDVQERVFDEIMEIFSTPNVKITHDSLSKLNYLDKVIKESMRLIPAVPIIGRETLEEIEIGEKKFPKGINILIHIFNLHRRKDIWGEDADQFNPERFSNESVGNRHSYAFLPFSEGLRDCIGKQYALIAIKTMLVTFLRNYKLCSGELKSEELTYKADITLKICQNISMRIDKR